MTNRDILYSYFAHLPIIETSPAYTEATLQSLVNEAMDKQLKGDPREFKAILEEIVSEKLRLLSTGNHS